MGGRVGSKRTGRKCVTNGTHRVSVVRLPPEGLDRVPGRPTKLGQDHTAGGFGFHGASEEYYSTGLAVVTLCRRPDGHVAETLADDVLQVALVIAGIELS